ncbi:MAG: protein kinase [Polyangiaceae bacterium]|nr:protein kinase [Polyangiaceae bacterium]
MNFNPGEIIGGKYRILRLLGAGGMGAVYEGENTRIKRRVAIKLLHAAVSSQAESVTRFEREAQAAARIGSDHICEVLDLGELPDGTRYMVMEYMDGETLGSRIQRTGRMGPEKSIPIMSQVLDALGAAHAAGIIHRDLKPDNIFLLTSKAGIPDFVKILDFGVSKFSQLSGDEMNMTRAGAVVGTPYYMSPEQARGMGQVDARSDVYALGVVLYQATTGQVPFQAQTFNELLFKIVLEQPPPPQAFVPDLDPEFAAIVQRAMSREPAHRFQSCAEFKDALLAWLAARPHLTGQSPALASAAAQRPAKTEALPAMLTPLPAVPTPMPGAQQVSGPTPAALTPSGSSWAAASGGGAQQAPVPNTANAWGNASGTTGQTAKPAAKVPVAAIAIAVILLIGGAASAWLLFGRPKAGPVSATQQVQSSSPVATETAAPAATETAPPVATESAAPAATESAAAVETAAPAASTGAPVATPRVGGQPAGTMTGRLPAASTTGKTATTGKTVPTGSPKDPGY